MSSTGEIGRGTLRGIGSVRKLAANETRRLLDEIGEVRGLIPLLMKPRDHQRWTRADTVLLRRHIKRVSMLSPYLLLLLMPGGLLALPVLAWWQGRRRGSGE
jgi:hypothetical protein